MSGVTVPVIRPARPSDRLALGDFFAELSAHSRYLRFFSSIAPGPTLLRLLAGGDGTTDAILATRDGAIIGHGMAADRPGPGGSLTTDIGVVVADVWQRRGVGSALVRALIAGAQVRGVTSVTMDVMHGNDHVIAMIKRHWPDARPRRSRDCTTLSIQLADEMHARQLTAVEASNLPALHQGGRGLGDGVRLAPPSPGEPLGEEQAQRGDEREDLRHHVHRERDRR